MNPKDQHSEGAPEEGQGIDRREFLRRTLATGAVAAGFAVAGGALWQRHAHVPGFEAQAGVMLPDCSVAIEAGKPTMAVAHGSDTEAVLKAAIGELGGIERFIKKGDVVVLKPNVAFDRPPALGATTHPQTLRAVAQLVLEAGAKEVRIADNPINSPEGCFLRSGLAAVANQMNLDIVMPAARAFGSLKMDGQVLRHWPLFVKPFEGANKVIGIAPCKDHNLCHASMTMKNWYGLLGGRRNQFHQMIHGIISDFAMMVKPTLVVLDGMRVLQSNGPTGGRLSDVKEMNTIVVGTDMVAVDAYGFEKLMERDLALLEYIHMADSRGLGKMNWRDSVWREIQVG